MKVRKLIDSFNYAVDGIIHTLKTQRNMRIHFFMATIVLFFSLFFKLSKVEVLILFLTISLVIATEMINTAIEAAIDLVTEEYHEFAKIAKNVAAGAVLIAAINAVVVGYLIFFDELNRATELVLHKVRGTTIHIVFISFIIVSLIVIGIKAYIGKGTPFRGGMPSGHTAIAFSIVTSIAFISQNTLVISLSFFMAILVTQSRIEAGIHSTFEVIMGGILGIFITVLIFRMIY